MAQAKAYIDGINTKYDEKEQSIDAKYQEIIMNANKYRNASKNISLRKETPKSRRYKLVD